MTSVALSPTSSHARDPRVGINVAPLAIDDADPVLGPDQHFGQGRYPQRGGVGQRSAGQGGELPARSRPQRAICPSAKSYLAHPSSLTRQKRGLSA
jgi:hypothetical protein